MNRQGHAATSSHFDFLNQGWISGSPDAMMGRLPIMHLKGESESCFKLIKSGKHSGRALL